MKLESRLFIIFPLFEPNFPFYENDVTQLWLFPEFTINKNFTPTAVPYRPLHPLEYIAAVQCMLNLYGGRSSLGFVE